MSTTEDDNQQPWTTWEELILAFAVKRHGCRTWDAVVNELHTRTKLQTSPDACRLKFLDLRRRFAAQNPDDGDDDLSVPWVEDLRRLRVDELRAEVNRHDVSISSLQSKVKKLEQDREQSLKDDEEKPSDLERSDNDDHRDAEQADRHADDDDEESDPENQSVNGSNSTGPNKAKERGSGQNELDPTQPEKTEQLLPGSKPNESSSTSRDESSDSIGKTKRLSIESKTKKAEPESDEGGTKTDSDVQSSATLSKKRRRLKEAEADGNVKTKSEPLISVLDLVRAHKDASFFERRLQIQETKLYNNVVRQHMDLHTVQTNLDSGSYASSHLNFFRDLLLIFTNAVIFYSKSSPEFKAAQELRSIVSDKMDEQFKQSQRSEEKLSSAPPSPRAKLERSDSLLGKHKPSGSGPIVVCRKRSSIAAKGKGEQQSDTADEMKTVALADLKPSSPKDERSLLNSKTKDRIVTGTRSMRRSNTSLKKHVTLPNATAAATTSTNSKKETGTTILAATTDKKKEDSSASKKDDNSAAKKRGAADFLKRLKGNSPVKSKDVKSDAKGSGTADGEQKKKNGNGDKVDGRRKITTRQSDQGKQTSKTEGGASPTKRNVGRPPSKKAPEPGAAGAANKRARDTEASGSAGLKQPKKRTKR
ncbi:unnamed protein product [Rhodiola kirilowii]